MQSYLTLRHPVWSSPAKIEALKAMWDEGLSSSVIGARLGMTRCAVIGKVRRLGLPHRRRGLNPLLAKARAERGPRKRPVRANGRHPQANGHSEPPPLPEARNLSLLDLGRGDCHWPVGDPGTPGFAFCGAPGAAPADRRPYCPYHMRLASKAPSTPERPF
jgi:GcrA cell cycle regulator